MNLPVPLAGRQHRLSDLVIKEAVLAMSAHLDLDHHIACCRAVDS